MSGNISGVDFLQISYLLLMMVVEWLKLSLHLICEFKAIFKIYFELMHYAVNHQIWIISFCFAGWFCSCYNSFDIDGWDLPLQLLLDTQMCWRDRYSLDVWQYITKFYMGRLQHKLHPGVVGMGTVWEVRDREKGTRLPLGMRKKKNMQ